MLACGYCVSVCIVCYPLDSVNVVVVGGGGGGGGIAYPRSEYTHYLCRFIKHQVVQYVYHCASWLESVFAPVPMRGKN